MFRKKNILFTILLVIVAGTIYTYKQFSRTTANVADESSAYSVTAHELIKEFTDDDSLANQKYVGKILSVRGMIKDLIKDDKGRYTVSLGDTAGMSSIRCSIDSIYSATVKSIKPGMNVIVKGNCTGYNEDELLGSDIVFNRCLILEHN